VRGIPGKVCCECGATQTPQWREGPQGELTVVCVVIVTSVLLLLNCDLILRLDTAKQLHLQPARVNCFWCGILQLRAIHCTWRYADASIDFLASFPPRRTQDAAFSYLSLITLFCILIEMSVCCFPPHRAQDAVQRLRRPLPALAI
jgi:hypothetical protein